jgi:hypothetical protein
VNKLQISGAESTAVNKLSGAFNKLSGAFNKRSGAFNKFRGHSTKFWGHSTAFSSSQQNFGGIQQISGAFNSSQHNFGGIQQQLTRHSKRPFRTTFRKLVMAITAENGIYTFLPQLSAEQSIRYVCVCISTRLPMSSNPTKRNGEKWRKIENSIQHPTSSTTLIT